MKQFKIITNTDGNFEVLTAYRIAARTGSGVIWVNDQKQAFKDRLDAEKLCESLKAYNSKRGG